MSKRKEINKKWYSCYIECVGSYLVKATSIDLAKEYLTKYLLKNKSIQEDDNIHIETHLVHLEKDVVEL